jgi:hypothetical protein
MLGWGPSFTTKLSAFIFGRLASTNKILVVYETTRLNKVKLARLDHKLRYII